jgi:hypothetical protein
MHSTRIRWVVVVVAASITATCYRPAREAPCTVSCETGGAACPGAMFCGTDNFCHTTANDCVLTDGGSAGSAAYCYGSSGLGRYCFDDVAGSSATLPLMIDTSAGSGCTRIDAPALGPPVCVARARDIDVTGTVVTGDRPLVLIADAAIRVTGPLNAAAGTSTGPGANVACISGAGDVNTTFGGGGAGASYQGVGGIGGASEPSGGSASSGGQPNPTSPLQLLGGCYGGPGEGPTGTFIGGGGGGALYLIATAIVISSLVDVSGGPGQGGQMGGGGGGGAGGALVLEATTISLAGATLRAMGGAGGGGGGFTNSGMAGNQTSSNGCTAPSGGIPGSGAGMGGPGATSTTDMLQGGATTTGGGGGGGGGVGWIRLFTGSPSGAPLAVCPSPST